MSAAEISSPAITWRIDDQADFEPASATGVGLKVLAAAEIALAAFLFLSNLVSLATTAAWLVPSLAILWLLSRRRAEHHAVSDEVTLDHGGLAWTDAFGRRHRIERAATVGYRIGLESNTARLAPALTLLLAGGFESQPLEIRPPADAAAVRALLSTVWQIAERRESCEQIVARLQAAFFSFVDAWPPSPEKRLLGRGMTRPAACDAPQWLIASTPRLGQVFIDPDNETLRWQCIPPHSDREAFPDGAALLAQVRERLILPDPQIVAAIGQLLPGDVANESEPRRHAAFAEFLAQELATDLAGPPLDGQIKVSPRLNRSVEFEGELRDATDAWEIAGEAQWVEEVGKFVGYVDAWSQRERAAWSAEIESEATQLGFRFEPDNDAGVWRLTGSRSALSNWAADLALLGHLAPAPAGAKPQQVRFGGRAMRMEVEVGAGWWIDGITLHMEPKRLLGFANDLRKRISTAPLGKPIILSLADDPHRPTIVWKFEINVQSEP